MLGKLLKHEFRATGRIMLPLYLVLLVMSIFANFSVRLLDNTDSRFLNMLGGLLIMGFTFAIIGVTVMSLVLMVTRFYRNLMSDEGYVMFTLPVSVHGLVWSKIIVSSFWFFVTVVADILAGIIVVFQVDFLSAFWRGLQELTQYITAEYAINGVAFLLEFLVLCFFGCASMCLLFYASMAIGHSFAGHKVLYSIGWFFTFQFITQFAGMSSLFLGDMGGFIENLSPMAITHLLFGVGIAVELVYCAIFYLITVITLQKRLNLE
ncbi:MAG: hypothetical protein RRY95_07060 [Oscillospiraceae bacterium]